MTKGCWLVPVSGADNCTGDDCQAAVSYRKQGDLFLMEMAVKGQDQYIAVGFSDDEIMVKRSLELICNFFSPLKTDQPQKLTVLSIKMYIKRFLETHVRIDRSDQSRLRCTSNLREKNVGTAF